MRTKFLLLSLLSLTLAACGGKDGGSVEDSDDTDEPGTPGDTDDGPGDDTHTPGTPNGTDDPDDTDPPDGEAIVAVGS
ncbi:MAG: hypothetical protein H0V89_13705, partial [Deltaproteobacteria bacterium]|nr:hypothetical protein [Deltaproteobacteria bacterium]